MTLPLEPQLAGMPLMYQPPPLLPNSMGYVSNGTPPLGASAPATPTLASSTAFTAGAIPKGHQSQNLQPTKTAG